jgi:hypothetical protein
LSAAAAALIATPPAVAQPVQLTPPAAAPAPTDIPEAAAAASEAASAEQRGPTGPLPSGLALAEPATAEASPAAPAEPAEPRIAPTPTATVSVGAREDFTRLAFRFEGPTTVTPLLQGDRLDLRFSRAADVDLAELRANPPRYVREVRRVSAPGAALRIQLILDPDVRQRHFVDGDRVIVDLLGPANSGQQTQAGPAPAPASASVVGVARVRLVEQANDTRITVSWPAPARAAAFRRGEAIWLLFDAAGRVDLTGPRRPTCWGPPGRTRIHGYSRWERARKRVGPRR